MKKLALITFCGMLAFGASSYVVHAQNLPTTPPDTSVTARPTTTPDTSVTHPARTNESTQAVKEKSRSNNGVTIGIIAAALILGLGIVLISNKKKVKKQ